MDIGWVCESECPACSGIQFSRVPGRDFLSFCDGCGLVFDNPRPGPEVIAAYYNRETQYDAWLQNLEARDRMWGRRLEKMRRHRNPGSLLDVGTGIGQFLSLAREEYNPVAGTEISSTAIGIARELYNLEILKGTIETLAIEQQFNNVTAFHVLEHVHWPAAFLERCRQLLKLGGRMFLAVPNDVDGLTPTMRKNSLAPISLSTVEIHLSHFTKKSLARLLARTGFEVIHLSLDPFWADLPPKAYFQKVRYVGMQALHSLTGANLYPTIWAVAQKS